VARRMRMRLRPTFPSLDPSASQTLPCGSIRWYFQRSIFRDHRALRNFKILRRGPWSHNFNGLPDAELRCAMSAKGRVRPFRSLECLCHPKSDRRPVTQQREHDRGIWSITPERCGKPAAWVPPVPQRGANRFIYALRPRPDNARTGTTRGVPGCCLEV
jgi:hypothetical protein